MPIQDLRPNMQKRPNAIALCFVFSTILNTGGVEAWYWSLFDSVFKLEPFAVHAVQLNDLWSVPVVDRFASEGVIFNPGLRYMADTCDIIVSTGSQPLHEYNLHRRVPRILVIHGSKGCEWTWRYAQHAAKYDRIVGVSRGSADVLDSLPEEKARVSVIPSGIDVSQKPRLSRIELLRLWKVPDLRDLRILLYLGRISSEKNPQFFHDVVDALPSNWVGLMVGPAYFVESFPVRTSSRVIMTGRWDNAADPMSVADVALIASPSEGGPIVLLEAWAARVPFFMRRTGIAAAYPSGVFIIGDDESAGSVAGRVQVVGEQRFDKEVVATVESGYKTVMSVFAIERTSEMWRKLLLEVGSSQRSCDSYTHPLHFTIGEAEGFTMTVDGHHRIFEHSKGAKGPTYAELSLKDAIRSCHPMRVLFEYVLQSDATAGDFVGSIELSDSASKAREHRALSIQPLVYSGSHYSVAEMLITNDVAFLRVNVAQGASLRVVNVVLLP